MVLRVRIFFAAILLATLALGYGVHGELKNSRLQAQQGSRHARNFFFWIHRGTAGQPLTAPQGPFDRRRGYDQVPAWAQSLDEAGFELSWQAGASRSAHKARDLGLFPIYDTNPQAGLMILGQDGSLLHRHSSPQIVFESFESLPDLLVQTLLFIENRELLEPGHPFKNPAVEWPRFFHAILARIGQKLGLSADHFGGSTLATQLEKFRHSPDGRTEDEHEKLRQMLTASLRAYRDGPKTLAYRQALILEYINGVPLAASAGYGEVYGIGDGLRVWFGADPHEVLRRIERLGRPSLQADLPMSRAHAVDPEDARAFRMVLSLFLAHRRPSYYLRQDQAALHSLTDSYARHLANKGLISPALQEALLASVTPIQGTLPLPQRDFRAHKAVDALRTNLKNTLNASSLYEVDRFDLFVQSTIDGQAQHKVDELLARLQDPQFLQDSGLIGHRLLDPDADLDSLIVSFTLFETTPYGNALRVLADNHDEPLNINEHIKIDLGSTAKLRTLVTYLEIISALHQELRLLSTQELKTIAHTAPDRLRRWTASQLLHDPALSKLQILERAMDRHYSADPGEAFFTGGGLHRFSNFENRRNHTQSVREAFRHSVNLVFIRMMRDIADHFIWLDPSRIQEIFDDQDSKERSNLLARFADQEGSEFQRRFYERYKDLAPSDILPKVVEGRTLSVESWAMIALILNDQTPQGLQAFVNARSEEPVAPERVALWWERYTLEELSWQDRGYLTGVHPLELWTAAWLYEHPGASLSQLLAQSRQIRQEVYRWLFRSSSKRGQDRRIQTLLEQEAFDEIHRMWVNVGYPFDSLVPSFATSLGSSADRPIALARLLGIILNEGLLFDEYRVDGLIAAPNTPYEARFERRPASPRRVLSKEVAHVAKQALIDVAQKGTGRRIQGLMRDVHGEPILVGGKTGTGDHRLKIYEGSRLVGSRPVNRTATFAFFLTERFFGTLTVFVAGEAADNFHFTSALPATLLTTLYPAIRPLLEDDPPPLDEERWRGISDPGSMLALAAAGADEEQLHSAFLLSKAQVERRPIKLARFHDWKATLAPINDALRPRRPHIDQPNTTPLDWHDLLQPHPKEEHHKHQDRAQDFIAPTDPEPA